MYQQKAKKCIICIISILFFLCFAVTLTETTTASADVVDNQTMQQYGEQSLFDSASPTATVFSSEDKAEYKNLGTSRLSEGDQGLTQLHYIENANYFLVNPLHHQNDTDDNSEGTCTTVALQMLVGYHNYYSDRRLLPQYNKNGKKLLENDYGKLTEHPTIDTTQSSDKIGEGMGKKSIGTADGVYDRIFDETFWASFPGLGQTIPAVTRGAKAFLEKDSELTNWTLRDASYNKSYVLSELDADRPVIIGFDLFEGHSAHVIVAYGYATYEGQLCYITHYGWGSKHTVQMLVPESWLGYQITMNVSHTHTFIDTGETYNNTYRALSCTTCGYTAMDNKYIPSLFAGGAGTVYDPFLISNAEQLRSIGIAYRSVYISGQGGEKQINYAFKLTKNITISEDWIPFTYKFSGNFDGSNHYISYQMYLTQEDINASNDHGLFGFITEGAKITNLKLLNCKISNSGSLTGPTDDMAIGILAGGIYRASEISNITIESPEINCNIKDAMIGGICGTETNTNFRNCAVLKCNITSSSGCLGGMAGIGADYNFSGGTVSGTLTKNNYSDSDLVGPVVGNSTSSGSVTTTGLKINKNKECIAAGTLITLANGDMVPVESLTGNEMLLVWNLKTGSFDSAPILFIDVDSAQEYEIVNLSFSDGTSVKVISEHGFWDFDLNRYVYLNRNAAQYLGHSFNKQTTDENGDMVWSKVQLVGVTLSTEYTAAYSPVTYSHLCYYVNGMLSMPGGIDGLFNIFEVDGETMKYDEAQMQADIAEYGLFTYEEFATLVPVTEEVFGAFNGEYMKVAIGKELISVPELNALATRYARYF